MNNQRILRPEGGFFVSRRGSRAQKGGGALIAPPPRSRGSTAFAAFLLRPVAGQLTNWLTSFRQQTTWSGFWSCSRSCCLSSLLMSTFCPACFFFCLSGPLSFSFLESRPNQTSCFGSGFAGLCAPAFPIRALSSHPR